MSIESASRDSGNETTKDFFGGNSEVDDLCLPVFLKDFVVVVKVKHRIAKKVIDSIFVTHVTEPILAASDTSPNI